MKHHHSAIIERLGKKLLIQVSHLTATVGSTETQNRHSVLGQRCKHVTLILAAKVCCIVEVSESLP